MLPDSEINKVFWCIKHDVPEDVICSSYQLSAEDLFRIKAHQERSQTPYQSPFAELTN